MTLPEVTITTPAGRPCVFSAQTIHPHAGLSTIRTVCMTHGCSVSQFSSGTIQPRCLGGRVEDIEARIAVVEQLVRRLTETIKGAPDA